MHTSSEIARKIISLYGDSINVLTNAKLQALLYFEQGYHLARFGAPLFDEDVVTVDSSPFVFVPSVDIQYEGCGKNPIPLCNSELKFKDTEEEILFYNVFDYYDNYSASGLAETIRSQTLWQETKTGDAINQDDMKEYFNVLSRYTLGLLVVGNFSSQSRIAFQSGTLLNSVPD